jgi:hypothetical protein
MEQTVHVAQIEEPGEPIHYQIGEWQSWYAWRPVKLYMTPRYAWLRPIFRRCVMKGAVECCDYTDRPDDFPTPAA